MLFAEPDVDCFRIDLTRIALPNDVLALEPELTSSALAHATRIPSSTLHADLAKERKAGAYAGWQPGRVLPAMALLGAHQKPRALIEDRKDPSPSHDVAEGKSSCPDATAAATGTRAQAPRLPKKHAYEHITLGQRADALHRALLSTLYARFPYELKDTIEHVYVLVLTHMAPPSFSAQPLTVEEIAELTTYHQFLPAELRYRTHPSHLGPLLDPIVEVEKDASPPSSTEGAPLTSTPSAETAPVGATPAPFQLPKFYDTFYLMARDLSPPQRAAYQRVHGDARLARRGPGLVVDDANAHAPTSPTVPGIGASDDVLSNASADGMTRFTVVDGHFTHYVLSTHDDEEQHATDGNRKVDGEGLTGSLDELAERQWERAQAEEAKKKKNKRDSTGAAPQLSDRQRRLSAREAARAIHFSVYRLPLNLFSTDDQHFYMRTREELRFQQCLSQEDGTSKGMNDHAPEADESTADGWLGSLNARRTENHKDAMKDFFASEMPSRHRAERDQAEHRFFKQCRAILANMVTSRLATEEAVAPTETAAATATTTTATAVDMQERVHEVSQYAEQKQEAKQEDVIVIAPPARRRPLSRTSSAHEAQADVVPEDARKPKGKRTGPPAALLARLQSKTASSSAATTTTTSTAMNSPRAEVCVNEEGPQDGAGARPAANEAGLLTTAVVAPPPAAAAGACRRPVREGRAEANEEEANSDGIQKEEARVNIGKKPVKGKGPPAALLARLQKKTAPTAAAGAEREDAVLVEVAAPPAPSSSTADADADADARKRLEAVTEAARRSCAEENRTLPVASADSCDAITAPAPAHAHEQATAKATHSPPAMKSTAAPLPSVSPQRIPGVSCEGATRLLYSLVPCDCYHMVMDDVNPLYYAKSGRAAYAPHTITLGLISDLSLAVSPTRATTADGARSGAATAETSRLTVRASTDHARTSASRKVYAPSRMSGLLSGADGAEARGLEPGKLYYITEDGLVASRQASRATSPDRSDELRAGEVSQAEAGVDGPVGGGADEARGRRREASTHHRRSTVSAPARFSTLVSATDGYLLVKVSLTCNDISGNPKHAPESLRLKGARLPEYLAGSHGTNEKETGSGRSGLPSTSTSSSSSSSSGLPVVDLFKALASSSLAQHKLRFGGIRPVVSVAVLDGTAVLDGSLFTEKQQHMARGQLFGDGVGGGQHTAGTTEGRPHGAAKSEQSRDFTCRGLVDHTWLSLPVQRTPYCQEALQWMPVVLGSTDCVSDVGSRTAVHLGFFVSHDRRRQHEEAAKEKAAQLAEEAKTSVGRGAGVRGEAVLSTLGTLPTRAGALSSLTPSAPLPRAATRGAAEDVHRTDPISNNNNNNIGSSGGVLLGERHVNTPQSATDACGRKGGVAFTFPATTTEPPIRPPRAATANRAVAFDICADTPLPQPSSSSAQMSAAADRPRSARPASTIRRPRATQASPFEAPFAKSVPLARASPSSRPVNAFDEMPVGGRQPSPAPLSRWDDVPVGGHQSNAAPPQRWDDVPVGGRQSHPVNLFDERPVGGRQSNAAPAQMWDDVPVGGRQPTTASLSRWDDVPVGRSASATMASRTHQAASARLHTPFDDVPVLASQRHASQMPGPAPSHAAHAPGMLQFSPPQPRRGAPPPPPPSSASSLSFGARPVEVPPRRSYTPPPHTSFASARALEFESGGYNNNNNNNNNNNTSSSRMYHNPFSTEAVHLSTVRRSTTPLFQTQASSFPVRGSPTPAVRPTVNLFGGGGSAHSASPFHSNNTFNNNNNNNNNTSWMTLGNTANTASTASAAWGGFGLSSPPPRGTARMTTMGTQPTNPWPETRAPGQGARFSNVLSHESHYSHHDYEDGGRHTPLPIQRDGTGWNPYGPRYTGTGGAGGDKGRFSDGDLALTSPISPLSPSGSRHRYGGDADTTAIGIGGRRAAPRATAFAPLPGALSSMSATSRMRMSSAAPAVRHTLGMPSASGRGDCGFYRATFAINEYNDTPCRPGSRVRARGVTAMDTAWSRPVHALSSAPGLRQARPSTRPATATATRMSSPTWGTTSTARRTANPAVLGRPPLPSSRSAGPASTRPPLYPRATAGARTAASRVATSRSTAASVRERLAARKAAAAGAYEAGLRDNYMVGSDPKRARFEVPVTIAEPEAAGRRVGADGDVTAYTTSSPVVWNWADCLSPAQTALEAEAQARSLGAARAVKGIAGMTTTTTASAATTTRATVQGAAKAAEQDLLAEHNIRQYQSESQKLKYMADLVDDSCDGVNVSFTLRDMANALLLMPCGRPDEHDVCEAAWASEGVSYFLSRKPNRLSGGWESYMERLNVYQEPFYLRDQAFIFVLRVPHHPQLRVCVALHNVNDLLALLHETPVACILPTQEEIWLQERRYANSEYDRYWHESDSDAEDNTEDAAGGRGAGGRASQTGWRPKAGESLVVEKRWFFGLFKSTTRVRIVPDASKERPAHSATGASANHTDEDALRQRRARHRHMRRQFQADGLRFTWRHRLALWWLQLRRGWQGAGSPLCTSPLLTDPACFKARAAFLSDRIAAYAAVQHRVNTLKAIREAYVAYRAEALVRERTLRICARTETDAQHGLTLARGGTDGCSASASAFSARTSFATSAASSPPRAPSEVGRRAVGGLAMTFDTTGQLTSTRTATATAVATSDRTPFGEAPAPRGVRGGDGGPPASLLRRLSSKQPLASTPRSVATGPAPSASRQAPFSRAMGDPMTMTTTATTATTTTAMTPGPAAESVLERRKRIMAAARQSAHTGQKATLATLNTTGPSGPLMHASAFRSGRPPPPPPPSRPPASSSSPHAGAVATKSTIDHYAASGSLHTAPPGPPRALVTQNAGLDLVLHVQRSDELAQALERVATRRQAHLVAPLTTVLRVVPRSEQLVRGAGGGVVKSDAEELLYAGLIPTPLEIHQLLETYNISVRELQQLLQWQWEHHQHSYETVPLPIFRDSVVPAVDEYFRFLGQQRERFTGERRVGVHKVFENPFLDRTPQWQNAAPLGISPLARVLLLFASRWSWLVPINYEASRRHERLFFIARDVRQALAWQLSSTRVLIYVSVSVWVSQHPGLALCVALALAAVYSLVCLVRSALGCQSLQWRPASQRIARPLHARENYMPLLDDRTSLLYRQSEGAAAALLERQHDFPAQAMITRVLQIQACLSTLWSRLVLGLQGHSPALCLCLISVCLLHIGLYVCYQSLMNWVVHVNGGWCQTALRGTTEVLQSVVLPLVGLDSSVDAGVLDALEHVRDVLNPHAPRAARGWWPSSSWWWHTSSSQTPHESRHGHDTTARVTVAAYSQGGLDGKPHTYYQNGAYYTHGGRNEPQQGHAAYSAYARATAGQKSTATKATRNNGSGVGVGRAATSAAPAHAAHPAIVSAWNTFASTVAGLYTNPALGDVASAINASNVTVWQQPGQAGAGRAVGGHGFIPFLFFVYLLTWWLPHSPVLALWRRTWGILMHDDALARRPLLSF